LKAYILKVSRVGREQLTYTRRPKDRGILSVEDALNFGIEPLYCKGSMITTATPPNHPLGLLNVRRLPARLTAEQMAESLGFKVHDIPLLLSLVQ
jgi:hypothetical protein